MATACGCDDGEAMQHWGDYNQEWLSGFLDLPHGVPTQDVFRSVFAPIDPAAFRRVFISWAKILIARLDMNGTHIALDRKTSRRRPGAGLLSHIGPRRGLLRMVPKSSALPGSRAW